MAKHTVYFEIVCAQEIEIEADTIEDAKRAIFKMGFPELMPLLTEESIHDVRIDMIQTEDGKITNCGGENGELMAINTDAGIV